MPTSEPVRYQAVNGIGQIVLHRPEALNAMNLAMLERLDAVLDQIKADDAVKGVIVTGAGTQAFSAGADIVYLHRASPLEVRTFARRAVAVNHRIETLGKIVIAAINGFALGGGLELAESCMLRVAVRETRLGHPEVRIGAIAGFGGTTRLPRLIGRGRAADLLLTGRLLGAQEALEIGLVNRVVDPEHLLGEAERYLREVLAQAPVADYFGLVAATDDFRAGTRAFLNKTPASFQGR